MKKSDIFKIIAIFGVGATAYLAAKAVPYFEDYYEEWIASKNFSEDDSEKLEANLTFLKQSVKAFAPAVLSGAATIASIIMLDKDHAKQKMVLMSSLYVAKKALADVRKDPDCDIFYKFSD